MRTRTASVAMAVGAISLCALTVVLLAPAGQAETAPADGPVVLVGVGGLTWSDIGQDSTPALASFMSRAAVGHVSVRSVFRVTCPVDAWLTIGASRRTAAERVPGADVSDNTTDLNAFCPPIPDITDGRVDGWDALVDYNAGLSFNSTLGLLGSSADDNDVSVLAAGPGAAVGAADESGSIAQYVSEPSDLTSDLLASTDLTLIDLGSVDEREAEAPRRIEQVQGLDQDLALLLENVPDDATVMLLSGDNSRPTPELQVIAIRGENYPPGLLQSSSTKQDGLVLLTDLTPTIFSLVGMPPAPEFVGAPVISVPRDTEWQVLQEGLVDQARKVEVYSDVTQPFFTALVPLQLALYAGAAWAFRRRADKPKARRLILRVTAWVALTCSAIPVATFLSNLTPWWTWPSPHASLVTLVLLWALVIAAAARYLGRNRDLLAEIGVVAGVTAGVLAADVVLGGQLQTASLMGYSPVVAGRLYGFGNVAFALFATGLVFVAAWWGDVLYRRGRGAAAAWLVLGVGAFGIVIDGLPQLGSDFGGMLAIACGFGVFFLGVRQVAITFPRLLAIGAIAISVVSVVSFVDWLRPAEMRSHLGTFVQQVLDGEVLDVVRRKSANNLNILFSSVLGLLVPVAVIFLGLVLLRPVKQTPAVLKLAYQEAPMLRSAVMGWVTLMAVGFAVNDSGVAIPAVGIMMAIPFLIVISVNVLAQQEDVAAVPNHSSQ